MHETLKICDECRIIYRANEARRLIPNFCRFGFNVLVYVGEAIFVRNQAEKEIQRRLRDKGVTISIREVGYLGKKFIAYLALAHKEVQGGIRDLLSSKGGYILHLDGTCEGDSPHLMSALDGISDIVLGNVKLPSEKADEIKPFLESIKST